MAEDRDILIKIAKSLEERNKKASAEQAQQQSLVSSLQAELAASGKAMQQAIMSGDSKLQKALKASRETLKTDLSSAMEKLTVDTDTTSSVGAIGDSMMMKLEKTFGSITAAGEHIYQKQRDIVGDLEGVNDQILSNKKKSLELDEKMKAAEEKKDVEAYNRLKAQQRILEKETEKLTEQAQKFKDDYNAQTANLSALGLQEDEDLKTKVAEDPNDAPDWAVKMHKQLGIANMLSKEGFAQMGESLMGLGSKIADGLSSLPGMDAAKSFFGAMADLAKKIFIVIGGFTALNGFLDGMEKASEWFGDDANFKELFASGLAGIAEAFGLVTEGDAQALAEKIVSVFDWIQEKIEWMFAGVKKVFDGVKTSFKKIGEAIDNFDRDPFGSIWVILKSLVTDVIGNLNAGAVAALAIIAPKFTLGLVGFFVKTVIPKVIGVFSTSIMPMLATVGSALMTAFTALGSVIMTTVAPMAAFAAPFIAAAAAIALVIKGIYDGIMAGVAVFDDTGSVLEGLKAGISTMFGTILGFIPDLIKNIISWAARKLGFEDFADNLDSFSFSDAITDAFMAVMDWFQDFPAKIKRGLYGILGSFTNPLTGNKLFNFDEELAELDKQAEERAETRRKRDEGIAARREAEKAEDEAEQLEKQKLAEAEAAAAVPEPIDALAADIPEGAYVTQNITVDLKPITEGFKAMEKAFMEYVKNLDAEKKGAGATAVVNTNNSRKVVNNSTTAVSTGFSHRNIGATRGMFGAPTSPLASPN